jgi:hypothetical protein
MTSRAIRFLNTLGAVLRIKRHWLIGAALVCAAVAMSIVVVPEMGSTTSPIYGTDLELGTQSPAAHARATAAVQSNAYGYVIAPHATGSLTLPVPLLARAAGDATYLQLWVYGGSAVRAVVSIAGSDGRALALGAGRWVGHPIGVSSITTPSTGRVVLRVTATNSSSTPVLFMDKVLEAAVPSGATPTADRWLVALWAALVTAAGLAVWRWRLRRHFPLALLIGLGAFVLWEPIRRSLFTPLAGSAAHLWSAVGSARTIDLHHGLISGSFGGLSDVAIELDHIVTPIAGSGATGARTASALVALGALAALYAAGHRVAGASGAIAAILLALLAAPFRAAATSGDATPALLLASALLCLAIHAFLSAPGRRQAIMLGAAGALGVLADPLWLPGIVLGFAILIAVHGVQGRRLRVLGVCLLTIVALLLPSRASVLAQHGGEPFGDLAAQATLARNVEFVGRGYGAPAKAAVLSANPSAGPSVGIFAYVFGDHSFGTVAGDFLDGGAQALAAPGRQADGAVAVLAFAFVVVGSIYLLMVPKLRMLVLVPLLLALPVVFFVDVGAQPAFTADVPVWVGMLLGGSVLTYVVVRGVRGRLIAPLISGVAALLPAPRPHRAPAPLVATDVQRSDRSDGIPEPTETARV